MATIAIRSPRDEIAELSRLVGSQNGVARVLGRTGTVLSRWSHHPEKIRPRGRRLLSDALAVTSKVADVYGIEGTLESVLVTPRPELDYLRPAELIREGRTEELLERLDRLAGSEATVETTVVPAAEVDWRANARVQLEESMNARAGIGRFHEAFLFLRSLSSEEVDAFASVAEQVLETGTDEAEWFDFLRPYWRTISLPASPAPATLQRIVDDEGTIDENELDEFIRPVGGMVSRRFPRVS